MRWSNKMVKKDCVQIHNPKGYWVVVDTKSGHIIRSRPDKFGTYKGITVKENDK